MTQLRRDLIVITADMADEPAQTMGRLEQYIINRENKIKTMTINEQAEKYALELFQVGKSSHDVIELVAERYSELGDYDIEVIVLAAKEIHNEKSIPLENNQE